MSLGIFHCSLLFLSENHDYVISVWQGSPDREPEAGPGIVESRAGESQSRGKERITALVSDCLFICA